MVVVCVVGAGTLGSRIAGELSLCGHSVRVWDHSTKALDQLPNQLNHDREELVKEGLLRPEAGVLGQVLCLARLEDAVHGAVIVVEAVEELLETKKQVINNICKYVNNKTIVTSSTLRIPLESIFSSCPISERTLGLRFLFPVYGIPEVEITPWSLTSSSTTEQVSSFLQRMGKTAYLRSGPIPLILNEEERTERWSRRAAAVKMNAGLGGRTHHHLPNLAHRGNFAPSQDDDTRSSRIGSGVDQECIICMDNVRSCLLSPCHHLVTCQDCGQMLLERRDSCPICRTSITQIINFFRS